MQLIEFGASELRLHPFSAASMVNVLTVDVFSKDTLIKLNEKSTSMDDDDEAPKVTVVWYEE